MKYLMVILIIILCGCTKNSGIIKTDKNTFFISIQSPQVSFGPPVQQKADAYEQANEFCSQKGKVVHTIEAREVNQVFGRHGSFHLTFSCVPE